MVSKREGGGERFRYLTPSIVHKAQISKEGMTHVFFSLPPKVGTMYDVSPVESDV